jgi:hypothetical protein
LNTNLWRRVFAFRDQEVFRLFNEVRLLENQTNSANLRNVIASILPLSGAKDDYDFKLSLTKENLGVEGGDLKFTGSG